MGIWLMQALRMLGGAALAGAGFEVGQRALGSGGGFAQGLDLGMPGGRQFVDGVLIPEHPHKRRRRRRALTASDRADIAFIAGTLDKGAGKAFAVQLAARAR